MNDKQSKHLASRARTGELLAAGRVPVMELRAGIIIDLAQLHLNVASFNTSASDNDDTKMGFKLNSSHSDSRCALVFN